MKKYIVEIQRRAALMDIGAKTARQLLRAANCKIAANEFTKQLLNFSILCILLLFINTAVYATMLERIESYKSRFRELLARLHRITIKRNFHKFELKLAWREFVLALNKKKRAYVHVYTYTYTYTYMRAGRNFNRGERLGHAFGSPRRSTAWNFNVARRLAFNITTMLTSHSQSVA